MAGLHLLLFLLCLDLANLQNIQVNIQQNNAQQIIQQNNIQQNIQQNNIQQNIIIQQNIKENIALIKAEFAERNLNTGALDLMESHIKGLGNNRKVTKAGTAISETLKFFEFHGENGGKQLAVSLVKLTGKFAEIGGAFAPPPVGSAITVGFDVINSIMSLIGVAPEAPAMRDIMKELLDQQTAEIRSMFEEFINDNFWKNFEYKAKGVVDNFIISHLFLRSTLKTGVTKIELQSSLCLFSLIQGGEFFTMLEENLKDTCKNMVTSKDETRCFTLLDYYSRISTMRQTQFDMLIKLTSIHFKNLPTAYQNILADVTDKMKRTLQELTMAETMDSLTCVRIKIASAPDDELIFTKNALIMVGQTIELSEKEKGLSSLVCPSSSTKMMVLAGGYLNPTFIGNGWASVELVSPSKSCPLTIPALPEWRDDYPAAAMYTTEEGEERVMLCGGDWSMYPLNNVRSECWSYGGKGSWRRESSLVIPASMAGMVSIKNTLYVLGGHNGNDRYMNSVQDFQQSRGWRMSPGFSTPNTREKPVRTVALGDQIYTALWISNYRTWRTKYSTYSTYTTSIAEKQYVQWLPLQNPPHAVKTCTVAIISGHAVWVINKEQDVSYLRLPHTQGSSWASLPKVPYSCEEGLGWSEKKLICLYGKRIFYYDEATADWIETPHLMHHPRQDNAYINVPDSWGCN